MEKLQTHTIDRSEFNKMLVVGSIVGILSAMGVKVTLEPGDVVMRAVEFNPGVLKLFAESQHTIALAETVSSFPDYPFWVLGKNPYHMSIDRLLLSSVEQAVKFANKGLKLTWESPEYTSIQELQTMLPTLGDVVSQHYFTNANDLYSKLPQTTRRMLLWSQSNTNRYDNIGNLPIKTYLGNFVTPEIKRKLKENDAKYSQASQELLQSTIPIDIAYKLDQAITRERNLGDSLVTAPIAAEFKKIRSLVEDQVKLNHGEAIYPSYVIGYLLFKNDGRWLEALLDAYIFYRLTLRNNVDTGVFGDSTMTKNLAWMKANIRDISLYANYVLCRRNIKGKR